MSWQHANSITLCQGETLRFTSAHAHFVKDFKKWACAEVKRNVSEKLLFAINIVSTISCQHANSITAAVGGRAGAKAGGREPGRAAMVMSRSIQRKIRLHFQHTKWKICVLLHVGHVRTSPWACVSVTLQWSETNAPVGASNCEDQTKALAVQLNFLDADMISCDKL